MTIPEAIVCLKAHATTPETKEAILLLEAVLTPPPEIAEAMKILKYDRQRPQTNYDLYGPDIGLHFAELLA